MLTLRIKCPACFEVFDAIEWETHTNNIYRVPNLEDDTDRQAQYICPNPDCNNQSFHFNLRYV